MLLATSDMSRRKSPSMFCDYDYTWTGQKYAGSGFYGCVDTVTTSAVMSTHPVYPGTTADLFNFANASHEAFAAWSSPTIASGSFFSSVLNEVAGPAGCTYPKDGYALSLDRGCELKPSPCPAEAPGLAVQSAAYLTTATVTSRRQRATASITASPAGHVSQPDQPKATSPANGGPPPSPSTLPSSVEQHSASAAPVPVPSPSVPTAPEHSSNHGPAAPIVSILSSATNKGVQSQNPVPAQIPSGTQASQAATPPSGASYTITASTAPSQAGSPAPSPLSSIAFTSIAAPAVDPAGAAPAYIVGTHTAPIGQSVTMSDTVLAVKTSSGSTFVVVGGHGATGAGQTPAESTYNIGDVAVSAVGATTSAQPGPIIVASQTIAPNAASEYVVSGQTLAVGSSITIAGASGSSADTVIALKTASGGRTEVIVSAAGSVTTSTITQEAGSTTRVGGYIISGLDGSSASSTAGSSATADANGTGVAQFTGSATGLDARIIRTTVLLGVLIGICILL